MGLDMYLHGEKFLYNLPGSGDEHPQEDGYEIRSKLLRLGYWRKHPNLHGYIVQNFAEGVDECQQIDLDETAIEKIIDAVARDDLPHTTGFFFGETDGSEREETLRIFKAALEWLRTKEGVAFRSVFYRASW
jgi:hypothetical protein